VKVGDLICYNAAGQRKKSLGIILDRCIRTDTGRVDGVDIYYRIHWVKSGDLLPRAEWGDPRDKKFHRYGSELAKRLDWFIAGDWLEVLNESR
jgi:hypothetical protein